MDADDRYCTNCRAVIPLGSDVCPECGVYAGDVFDGKLPTPKKSRSGLWVIAVLIVAGAGGFWYISQKPELPRTDSGPIRVVGDRPGGARRAPGAAISEPEAMLTLRRFLRKSYAIKDDCIAAMSKGYENGAYVFDTVNRCDSSRLGRWQVDAKTKTVTRAAQ